jgi:predicted transcriptional regulator
METENTALTKFTDLKRKVGRLFSLNKITPKDIEGFNDLERDYLATTSTEMLQQLKGEERDSFINKIDLIVPAENKNQIWEYNHHLINSAISKLMREHGVMPDKTDIAKATGLSRPTIGKHLKEYKTHPEYAAEMERFKFMASKVLANVYKLALNGDIKASKLYFEMVGAVNKQQPGAVVNEQNNYIQVNNTILSQENLRRLSAAQLKQIENIITNIE